MLENIDKFVEYKQDLSFYSDIFDLNELEVELNIWIEFKSKHQLNSIELITEKIRNDNLTLIFPNIVKILKVYLTIPVSSASSERSFSCLKRLKNYLRSTMTDDRLSSLSTLTIESQELTKIDINKTIDIFANSGNRRLQFY